jgi:putative addiction module component (TIGR02574 family)
MIQRNDPMIEQLKTLPDMDRLQIVDYLLESLDIPNQEIERLWVAEVQDRYAAYTRGDMKAVPIEEVFAKYKK